MLSRLTLVLALLLGVLAVPAAAAPAPSAAPVLSWGPVQTPDPYRGRVAAVDCVDVHWCMAVDDSGRAVRYVDGRWYRPVRVEAAQPLQGLRAVSCARRTMCFALDASGRLSRWNGARWSRPVAPAPGANLVDVSCPTPTACVAIGDRVASWNGSRWTVRRSVVRTSDEGGDLSCPGPRFCMAVVAQAGRTDVFEYRNGTWTRSTHFPSGQNPSVSCTSASFCLAVRDYDHVAFWTGHRWRRAEAPPVMSGPWSVSCTAHDRCVALGEALPSRGSQSAEWNGREWSQPRDFGSDSEVDGFDCVGRGLVCLAIDQMGGATWYHEHRWGHRRERDAAWGLLTAAACGTTRCTVLDRPGGVVSTSGRGWTRPARALPRANVSYHSAFALACKGAAFCLTADVGGVTRRWNGRSWTSVAASPVDGGTELSCADPRWCAEIGTFTGAMAVFDGARWHRWPSLGQSPQPWTISCGGRGSCVAASNGIVRVLRGGHWSARHRLPGTTTNSGEDVSCTSARFCMVVADYGKIWRWDGRTWHGEAIPAFPSAVSCTSPTFCAELDFTGVQLWDGTRWTPSTTLQQPEGTAYGLIACASPALCVIGSWTSETRVGRAA